VEYASEFRRMQHEIVSLRERNVELERELEGYRKKDIQIVLDEEQSSPKLGQLNKSKATSRLSQNIANSEARSSNRGDWKF
jgi:hypothetical protein